MRAASIVVIGSSTAFVLLGLSQTTEGLLSAALFMGALLFAPVTAGLAIAAATNEPIRSGALHHWLGAHGLRRFRIAELARCSGCGSSRVVFESVWVCTTCDHAPTAG
ncbi:MAG: hypothetical protein GY720_20445 [bacterium]|nr:hypothetical protein [bacterium]